ncbi:MAG: helix-turn-helix domain-containing protein [Solirubrobacteraceae bacterium]
MARAAEQSERAAAHLAIAELPQVDQRLMAMMWLLAEDWGYVTPAGTVLPLALTHETLGGLIGARRPTVTLALRDLSARGELIRRRTGWLIIGLAPHSNHPMPNLDAPGLLNVPAGHETVEQRQVPDKHDIQAAVRERAASLREASKRERQRTSEQRLKMTLRLRRCEQLRQRATSRCTP